MLKGFPVSPGMGPQGSEVLAPALCVVHGCVMYGLIYQGSPMNGHARPKSSSTMVPAFVVCRSTFGAVGVDPASS